MIVASAVNCALGTTLSECLENLKLNEIRTGRMVLDMLEETVDEPYFTVPDSNQCNNGELVLASMLRKLFEQADMSRHELARTGLFLGSSSFSVAESERQYFAEIANAKPHPLPMPIVGYNKLAESLAEQFKLGAEVHSYATACTSSANAVIYADALIQHGVIDHAIVIGCEFKNITTLLGFYGLELISSQAKILPFDERRDGLILGEACAAVLLSGKKESGSSVRFAGGACNTDTYSLTAANTDGSTIAQVIQNAVANADAPLAAIQAIKAHGTASMLNDEAEAAGILSVFATDSGLAMSVPPVFALKPYIGHCLGACGVVELALVNGALEAGFIPSNKDIAAQPSLGVGLAQANQNAKPGFYLLNYFAFGGNNVSLLIELM